MKTICHKDGTVTYWSVYCQVWIERARYIADNELAAMNKTERERVKRNLVKYKDHSNH